MKKLSSSFVVGVLGIAISVTGCGGTTSGSNAMTSGNSPAPVTTSTSIWIEHATMPTDVSKPSDLYGCIQAQISDAIRGIGLGNFVQFTSLAAIDSYRIELAFTTDLLQYTGVNTYDGHFALALETDISNSSDLQTWKTLTEGNSTSAFDTTRLNPVAILIPGLLNENHKDLRLKINLSSCREFFSKTQN